MYDYHIHTSFSDDSSTPIREMIDTAVRIGLKEIAITDHYDPDVPDRDFFFELDFPGYYQAMTEAKEDYHNRIKVIKGVEIGIQHGEILEKCKLAAKAYDYDFIIGSFHCAEGFELYKPGFYEGRPAEEYFPAFYTYMRDCLTEYKDYDVMAHFNYIDRYADRFPDPSVYMDLIEEILKIIVEDGKGIEINTSSYRYGMGERTTPTNEILRLYKDFGGEIITIGSDAHKSKDVGHRLIDAVDIIKAAGFKYLTTFEQRKPSFIRIDSL